MHRYLKNLNKINMSDLNSGGSNNASLGEMMNNLNSINLKLPQGHIFLSRSSNLYLITIFKK
jgi:phosphoenolpyruvate synthase/pyruvate phosphate dikinase